MVGSVDNNNVYFHMTCLLPKHWKLESLYIYEHAVKHKKIVNNQYHSLFEISNTKQKEIYIETIDHGRVTETYVAEILHNKIYCDKIICLKVSFNEFI